MTLKYANRGEIGMETTLRISKTRIRIDESSFFFTMSLFLLVTAVIGFAPRSASIISGTRASPPPIIHIHAALMLTWLATLVVQSGLSAAGMKRLHMRLGFFAFALIPTVAGGMTLATLSRFMTDTEISQGTYNLLLVQIRAIIMFLIFAIWGIAVRRKSSDSHKRFLLAATIAVLGASFTRMPWIPRGFSTFELLSTYQFLLFVPIVAYDIFSRGRLHRATAICMGLWVTAGVLVNLARGTDWWFETAPKLVNALI